MQKRINFIQSIPSTTWIITHNFGAPVVADVMIGSLPGELQKILPLSLVQDEDFNVLTVTFTNAQVGRVRAVTENAVLNLTTNPTWIPYDIGINEFITPQSLLVTGDNEPLITEDGDNLIWS